MKEIKKGYNKSIINKGRVLEEVKKIEKDEGIKILFLIESGSRAWGWESEDSDYDIRGVFVKEVDIFNKKNQINKVVGKLDIVLWDLEKFLILYVKSNPSCWEWLSSNIIYLDNPLRLKLKNIFEKGFSKYALKKHYVSMARQNFEKYINNIGDKANLKKYIYILRSVACVKFIEKNDCPPPKNYKGVIKYLPEKIQSFFEKIIKDKKKSESLTGARNLEVEKYICTYWKKEFKKDNSNFNLEELNKLFNKEINKLK